VGIRAGIIEKADGIIIAPQGIGEAVTNTCKDALARLDSRLLDGV